MARNVINAWLFLKVIALQFELKVYKCFSKRFSIVNKCSAKHLSTFIKVLLLVRR